jgi:mRNA interferase RelE/StbE
MTSYSIVFKKAAEKGLAAVNPRDRQRIAAAIDQLATTPRPHGCEKLSGPESLWRIRIGDFRVIYQIEDRMVTITVVRIGNRRDVYRRR